MSEPRSTPDARRAAADFRDLACGGAGGGQARRWRGHPARRRRQACGFGGRSRAPAASAPPPLPRRPLPRLVGAAQKETPIAKQALCAAAATRNGCGSIVSATARRRGSSATRSISQRPPRTSK